TPIALARDAPVVKPVVHDGPSGAARRQPFSDGAPGLGYLYAVELAGVHETPGRVLDERRLQRRVLVLPGAGNDTHDRKREHVRELEIALVVSGHGHDRTGSVLHEHVVGDPDRNGRAGRRIDGVAAREDAGLLLVHFPRNDVLALRALPVRVDVRPLVIGR